jgi:hypothetical protein
MELRGLRALMFKYDAQVRVWFDPDAQQVTISVDTSDDGSLKLKLIKIYQIPPPIQMGRSPSGAPYTAPYSDNEAGEDWREPRPMSYGNGLEGSWRTEGFLDVRNIAKDEFKVGYEGGGVYLYNPNLEKVTYFIGFAYQQHQSIELKKWNGSSWDTL